MTEGNKGKGKERKGREAMPTNRTFFFYVFFIITAFFFSIAVSHPQVIRIRLLLLNYGSALPRCSDPSLLLNEVCGVFLWCVAGSLNFRVERVGVRWLSELSERLRPFDTGPETTANHSTL